MSTCGTANRLVKGVDATTGQGYCRRMPTERLTPLMARNGRNWRASRQLTQHQVAARVGQNWTKATVSAVESGRRQLSIPELFLYARALEVGLPALISDEHPGLPLVGDLTAIDIQLLLTGEVAPVPEVDKALLDLQAAELERLAATRLGCTVTEVRQYARARFAHGTLHREREARLNARVAAAERAAEATRATTRKQAVSRADEVASYVRSAGSAQARGHVTRAVLAELVEYAQARS